MNSIFPFIILIYLHFCSVNLLGQTFGTSGIITADTKLNLDTRIPDINLGHAQFGLVTSTSTFYKWNGNNWEVFDNEVEIEEESEFSPILNDGFTFEGTCTDVTTQTITGSPVYNSNSVLLSSDSIETDTTRFILSNPEFIKITGSINTNDTIRIVYDLLNALKISDTNDDDIEVIQDATNSALIIFKPNGDNNWSITTHLVNQMDLYKKQTEENTQISLNIFVVCEEIVTLTDSDGDTHVIETSYNVNVFDNDSNPNNELQNLSLGVKSGVNVPIDISSGTGVVIDVSDNDNDSNNEIQTLSNTRTGTIENISILGGNDIDIDISDYLFITITETAHTKQIADALYWDGNSWEKSHTANYEALPTVYVERIIDANNYVLTRENVIKVPAHGYTGRQYLTENGTISTRPAQAIICELFTPIDDDHIQLNRAKPYAAYNLINDITTRNNTKFSVNDATTITLRIKTYDASGYLINWGDGAQTSGVSNTEHSHTYASSFTGFVELKGLDGIQVEEIETTGPFSVASEKLFTFAPLIEVLDLKGGGNWYGDSGLFPRFIEFFNIDRGAIFGDVTNRLSDNLKYLRCVTGCKMAVNWNKLPIKNGVSELEYIGLTGGSEGTLVYGDIAAVQFSNPTHIDVQGQSTLGGNLGFLGNFPIVFNLSGQCEINQYTAKAQGGTMNYIDPAAKSFIIAGNSSLTNTEIDNILIDLDSETTSWSNSGNIIFAAGGSRTSASDAAITSLKGKGATITINSIVQ